MCMRTAHVLGGFSAGAGLALTQGQPWYIVPVSATLGAFTAPGPDVDQRKWWRRLDKWVPDEWLGWGGPLQHRGITHFWGMPAAVAALIYAAGPWAGSWVLWAALAGWVSHLLLDAIFGQADPWAHRGPGIPVWPWWGHVGVGLDAGGLLERFVLTPVLVVAGAAVLAWPQVPALIHAATVVAGAR